MHAPTLKCDYCEKVAMYGGSLRFPNPEQKKDFKDQVRVCGDHLDRNTQKIVISYGGRFA